MAQVERLVHGVPPWLLKEYLLDLGGEAQGEDCVSGEGWTARFSRAEDFRIGSLAVGRTRLEIEGEADAIEGLIPRLEMKMMRGGA